MCTTHLQDHVLNALGGVGKGEPLLDANLAEGVENPGHGLGGDGEAGTALQGPDPPLVVQIAGQGEKGDRSIPALDPLVTFALIVPARAPFDARPQGVRKVGGQVLVPNKDLLHRLGEHDAAENLGEARGLLHRIDLRRQVDTVLVLRLLVVLQQIGSVGGPAAGLDLGARYVLPADALAHRQLLQLVVELEHDAVADRARDASQEGEPDHQARRFGRDPHHVEGGGLALVVADEADVGVIFQQAELGPVLEQLGDLAGGLPGEDGVVAAGAAAGQQVLGQRVVVHQQQPDPGPKGTVEKVTHSQDPSPQGSSPIIGSLSLSDMREQNPP